MRNTIIVKILSFQYLLGRRIGRNKARLIAMTLERVFTTLFGREAYEHKKSSKGSKTCAENDLLLALVGILKCPRNLFWEELMLDSDRICFTKKPLKLATAVI